MGTENIKKGILAGLEDIDDVSSLNVKDIDIDLIVPNPNNLYSISNIDDLADDINENGLYHPILVRPIDDGKYQIISGERRYHAVKRLGWIKITSNIRDNVNDLDSDIMLIQANAKTRELSDMEKAKQIKRLEELYKSKKEKGEIIPGKLRDKIGRDMGLSGVQVHRYKKLNNLIPELQELVNDDTLPMSTAEHFSDMSEDDQAKVFDIIKNKGLEIGRNEAKELKDKLAKTEDDGEKRLAILEDKLLNKEKEIEIVKNKANKDIQAKQATIDKLQENINAKENNLNKLNIELKSKSTDAEQLRNDIKAELEKAIEEQTLENSESNNKDIEELQAKLLEAEKNVAKIQSEYQEKINEKEGEIENLKDENNSLIDDYEKRLKEKKQREINHSNIENNMELLALCNQANQLLKTLVAKVTHYSTIDGFVMTDEVKAAIANVIEAAPI